MTKDELMALADVYAKSPLCVRQDGVIPARAALSDALEAVCRDAERYRWLLDFGKPNLWVRCGGMNAYDDVEAAIDAAMREAK